MFEDDHSSAILAGALIRHSAATRSAQQSARDANNAASGLAAMGMGVIATIEKERRDLANAQARIRELELDLLTEKAHAIGLDARVDAFVAAHPDSAELRDSGKKYKKSGNRKTMGRIRYEKAFDGFLISQKVITPEIYRID